MTILSAFRIEPVFQAICRWTSSCWRLDGSTRSPEHPPELTLLSYYALRPKDLTEVLRQAWALETVRPIESLISLLERRLDNVVFRMGFAGSIPEARKLIARGHILVNRYRPKSIGMSLWPGDVVHFAVTPYDQRSVSHHFLQRPLPSYLQYLNPCTTDRGMMLSLPNLGHSPFAYCRSRFNPAYLGSKPIPRGTHA
jgi:small subunit ribosomal protein S4